MSNKIIVTSKIDDMIAKQEQVKWALKYFRETLEKKSINVGVSNEIENKAEISLSVFIGGRDSDFLEGPPNQPESFIIETIMKDNQQSLVAIGADVRGLVYAILELADIVKYSNDPMEDLLSIKKLQEQPANKIRSVKRLFVNKQDDKLWFYDKDFWREYLSELASQRFNRFNLALGIGYDLGHDPNIEDFYFCFAYPFLISVPGYQVSVQNLPEIERKKNLEMMRFIGRESKLRGLEFQVGLWTHAFEPVDSPNVRNKILGLDKDNHAAYCREALKTLLISCPEIDGVTIRVHYESGIPEPAHLFWEEVLKGVALCGRPVGLDLHPKGIDDQMLQVAEDNGVPFMISPKYWAEHMGLPYHQAAIRETELPIEPHPEAGTMIITTTSRRFTRYGYADFFKKDRNYDILFRIWPGTQRVLLWGDPEMAAEYGRSGSFGGAQGIELMEPLSFKSRKTSETEYGRDPYADQSLQLGLQVWKKYLYSYRLWGRLLYNPDADPESWRRYLRSEFSEASESCENSLKYASRILPLVTVAHSPSVANNNYWPEIYSNIMIVDQVEKSAYHTDGQEPYTFNVASPLDPALFYSVDEFAEAMIQNKHSGKMSPLETANLLEKNALLAEEHLQVAKKLIDNNQNPSFVRWVIDIKVQIALGLFFANKFRAGTAYAFYERVGDPELLEKSLVFYRTAKKAWEQIIDATQKTYINDITFGYVSFMRGNWKDRMPAIEEDIRNMEKQTHLSKDKPSLGETARAKSWLQNNIQMDLPSIEHDSPNIFEKGEIVEISINVSDPSSVSNVDLNYRHANQAESYQTVSMKQKGNQFIAEIPALYTNSPYPLVYFFEIENNQKHKIFNPGFNDNLSNQPYYLIEQSSK